MLAASYWSLLAPAIDMAEDSGKYGSFAFLPVAVGFTLGAAFVYFADLAMPLMVSPSHHLSRKQDLCLHVSTHVADAMMFKKNVQHTLIQKIKST